MSVIDAIPIVDVPPLPPEVVLADAGSTTVPGDYRGELLKSFPSSQIGSAVAETPPQVVLPLVVDGGLPWNPGIGPPVEHTASASDFPPAETGDDRTPPPPAGLVWALAAILEKGIGPPTDAESEPHPLDEPPKPPRGLYRRIPPVLESRANASQTEFDTPPDEPPRSTPALPQTETTTIRTIATTFAFAHESPPLETLGTPAPAAPSPAPVASPPLQPVKFVPEIGIQPTASDPNSRLVGDSEFREPPAPAVGNVPEVNGFSESTQPPSNIVGATAIPGPRSSRSPAAVSLPNPPVGHIVAATVLPDAALPETKRVGDAERRDPQPSAPPAVARTDDARQSEAQRPKPETSNPAELVQRCVDACRQTAQQDRPFRVRLHPPELGVLQVEITRDEHAVSARLQVETAAARNVLSEHLSELRQSLARQGLAVDRIEVQLVDVRAHGDARHEADSQRHRESFSQEQQERNDRNQDNDREEPPHRGDEGRKKRAFRSSSPRREEMDVQI